MTINGNRRFKGNDGKSYFVQDSHKADAGKGKYILTVRQGDFYKICYNTSLNVLHFNTIKEAQREVLYCADFITTL